MNVGWFIAPEKLESNPAEPKLTDAVKKAGLPLFISNYKNKQYTYDIPCNKETDNLTLITHGPIQFIKRPKLFWSFNNFFDYGFSENCNVDKYFSRSVNYSEDFLNFNGSFFVTWKQLKLRKLEYDIDFDYFIRPNSGFKTFTGFVTDHKKQKINDQLMIEEQTQHIPDDELVLVAPKKKILGEYRFLCVDGEIVAGTQYMWDDRKDTRIDYPKEAFELATKVAKDPWQLDDVYMVDIAICPDRPYVVELNSFCSAGLYQMDRDIVVDTVTAFTRKNYV